MNVSGRLRLGSAAALLALAIVQSAALADEPVTRDRSSAIYDPVRHRMIVFGGLINSAQPALSEVWQLDLSGAPNWSLLTTANPGPDRAGHSAVYDPVRDRMIVFGGYDHNGTYQSDVWELTLSDPPTWNLLQPSGIGPSARPYHSAIYDPIKDRVVIYGGSSSGFPLSDAWSLWLSPTPSWEPIIPPAGTLTPAGRYNHSAVYDSRRDCMVVFGGISGHDDTWELSLGDTSTWTPVDTPLPRPQRFGHSAVYDSLNDRMLIFGGNDGNTYENDAWSLSRGAAPVWSALTLTGPPSPRAFHTAIRDSNRMIAFGGFPSVTEATWGLALDNPTRWSPFRPVLSVSPPQLDLPTATVGDSAVRAHFVLSNDGLLPLQVSGVDFPLADMHLVPPVPLTLGWTQAVSETLVLEPRTPSAITDSLIVRSDDPAIPRWSLPVSADVKGLDFDVRVLGDPAIVPLGASFTVIAAPQPNVHVQGGTLYYKIHGAAQFDSVTLAHSPIGFVAPIPAAAVTEQGVDYFVQVENGIFAAVQPSGAPDSFFTQPVSAAASFTALAGDSLVGKPIAVEVRLPAGAVFQSGLLHYRPGGNSAYATAAVAADTAGRLVGVIPDSMVTPRGVEYWIEVHTLESSLRYPVGQPPALLRTKIRDLAEANSHPARRYRLVTVPVDFGDLQVSMADLLANELGVYDPVRWRCFWYDPSHLGNVELSAAQADVFRPAPGRAFWLISSDPHRVDTRPLEGLSTPTDHEYAIELLPGWNLFGDPFDFPVAWSSVRRDTNVVSDPVSFDSSLGTLGDYGAAPPRVLAPFEGYFVHATQPATLWVSPLADTSAGAVAVRPLAPPRGGLEQSWRYRVSASTAGASDGADECGLRGPDEFAFDLRQWLKPPSPPGQWVRAAFTRDGAGEFRRDLLPAAAAGGTWQLELRSSTAGEPIDLQLSELVSAPAGHTLRILDRMTGEVIAPAVGAEINAADERIAARLRVVSLGSQPYRLTIVAGSPSYVAAAMAGAGAIPERTSLDAAAPNPFHEAARLRFGLPRAARVTLEVFSVLGQRVAAPIDGAMLEAGYHSTLWDGRTAAGAPAAAGVYLVRLTAGRETLTSRLVRLP
jgi:hypothetical protein